MKGVFGGEKEACPCSKECQEFQKLLELKNFGSVVYLHRPHADDGCTPSLIRQGEAVGGAVNPSEDVFIIYNKKNVKITTSELTSEFEKKNISCPRCRRTFEHAKELLKDVKSIDRKIVMGICDHCRKKSQTTKKPFCDCDQIVKKFMHVKLKQKEDTKKDAKILFPPEIGFLRTGPTLKKQKKTRTYSDLQINLGLRSPSRHEPDVQPKFYSHTDLKSDKAEISEIDSREFYGKQINLGLSSPSSHEPDVQPKFYFYTDLKSDKAEISEIDSREFYSKQYNIGLSSPSRQDPDVQPMFYSHTALKSDKAEISETDSREIYSKQINIGLSSPSRQDPDVQPMHYSHTALKSDKKEISETDSREFDRKQAVTFNKPTKPHEGVPAKIPAPSLLESDTTLKDTFEEVKELPRPSLKVHKREEIFEDTPSLDAKEALKRKHDLSLRQMMKLNKDTGGPHSVSKLSKRPEVYETPKSSPWEQMEKNSKYNVKSKTDFKKIPTPSKTRSKQDPSARGLDDPKASQRDIQDSYFESNKPDKKHDDNILKNEAELKFQRSVDKISRKMKKTKQLSRSESLETGKVLKPYFSFSFPKVKEKKSKKSIVGATSSHVIKDVREKYALKAEREKEKREQALKKKLDREEKKLQAEEKKRQALEDKEKYAKEQKILTKKEKSKEFKSEIDVVAENDTKSILKLESKSKQDIEQESKPEGKSIPKLQSKTKKGIEQESKPEEKGDLREAKSDADLGTKEKTKIDKRAENDLSKKLKLQEKKERREMEALKKQAIKDKELLKKEIQERDATSKKEKQDTDATSKKNKQETDATSKKEKQENDATSRKENQENDEISKKAIRTKMTDRDSSDETNFKMPKKESKLKSSVNEPPRISAAEFQKLKAEHLREKEERQKAKKLLMDSKAKELEKDIAAKTQKGEIQISKIKIKKKDSNEMLKLINLKETKPKMKPSDIRPLDVKHHRYHHLQSGQQSLSCPICLDSELELDVLSLEMKNNPPKQKTDIIIGEKIFKTLPRLEKSKKPEGVPIFFQKDFVAEPDHRTEEEVKIIPEETKPVQIKHILGPVEAEFGKGVVRYALSDRTFIDKGWTMLPTEKVVRKMNVYRMRPAHPEFDWFEHNKNKGLMTYDTGERLAEFEENGRGRWYYRNGRLALDYYDAEETNAQQRFVIYSSGEPDERGRTHPVTILATFDHLGNGIVFDHSGKIRLKYNQTEGVVLDRAIGPATHWQWHSLNDPPVLQQVMIDTQVAHKDPTILKLGTNEKIHKENEDMLAIEFDNFIREKTKKLSQKFKPFQIKMKAMKINEQFSLKILDQATVYLIYRDGTTNIKLNIGMLLDHKEIVDTDTAELGEVSNSLQRFPARTDSLAILQADVAYAQRHDRQRTNRERILRPQKPCASADILTAAASPPMRLPLITVPTGSSSSTQQCTGHCSRKPADNLYYNTRFLF